MKFVFVFLFFFQDQKHIWLVYQNHLHIETWNGPMLHVPLHVLAQLVRVVYQIIVFVYFYQLNHKI